MILFAVLLTLSCLLVSFATSFTLLLAGRACLGLALGGFWAMSASLTMRLVPPRTVPKALSVIFGAVSIALVIAAPLGSFLGGIIGWRHVFNAAAVMGVLCVIWVVKSLPSLPGEPSHQKQNIFSLLQRPGVMAGMIAIFMSFAGQFAFFTYIRPVYMNLAGFDVDGPDAGAAELWHRQFCGNVALLLLFLNARSNWRWQARRWFWPSVRWC
ncbi:ribonucleoside transporter [Citrobacter koseri]|uniref:Ribonucleoside transporter n=1 Tax=Citrobacter koseri TaxID=545 RepID=A0A2X2WII4_CITKO|nr:ribonucleoside transporter [Citrobacter koseri]